MRHQDERNFRDQDDRGEVPDGVVGETGIEHRIGDDERRMATEGCNRRPAPLRSLAPMLPLAPPLFSITTATPIC